MSAHQSAGKSALPRPASSPLGTSNSRTEISLQSLPANFEVAAPLPSAPASAPPVRPLGAVPAVGGRFTSSCTAAEADDDRDRLWWRGWLRFGDGGTGERMLSASVARCGAVEIGGGCCADDPPAAEEPDVALGTVLSVGTAGGVDADDAGAFGGAAPDALLSAIIVGLLCFRGFDYRYSHSRLPTTSL